MKTVVTEGLFKPVQSKLETKAQGTDTAARAIIEAEAASREAKTARLRDARLKKEAAEEPAKKPAKPAPRTQNKAARRTAS